MSVGSLVFADGNAGPAHPAVKEALCLVSGDKPNPGNLVALEGVWEHQLLATAGTQVFTFLCCPDLLTQQARHMACRFVHRANQSYQVSEKVFRRLSDREAPDGLLSICELTPKVLTDIPVTTETIVLILDSLQTAGNIGTIIRSADGAGANAVILVNNKVRLSNRKVVRSSEGSILRVPLVVTDFDDVKCWLGQNGFSIYITHPHANEEYHAPAYNGPTAIVAGNERTGVSDEWLHLEDGNLISIPMFGACDSLNVGIATSIVLYEAAISQRRPFLRRHNHKQMQGSPSGEPAVVYGRRFMRALAELGYGIFLWHQ